jgi:hypothetical protein
VPSPKLKTTWAIGVWSVSLDPLASAVTVKGAVPPIALNTSRAVGAESGRGDDVGAGLLLGDVATGRVVGVAAGMVGCAFTLLAAGRGADGNALGRAACLVVEAPSEVWGIGVVIASSTRTWSVASDGLDPTLFKCSARVKTKNGSVIATTSTVAPIE